MKTERGQRDVDFPELRQEGTYFPAAVVINGRSDDDGYIRAAEPRKSIHIILLLCVYTYRHAIQRLTSCQSKHIRIIRVLLFLLAESMYLYHNNIFNVGRIVQKAIG